MMKAYAWGAAVLLCVATDARAQQSARVVQTTQQMTQIQAADPGQQGRVQHGTPPPVNAGAALQLSRVQNGPSMEVVIDAQSGTVSIGRASVDAPSGLGGTGQGRPPPRIQAAMPGVAEKVSGMGGLVMLMGSLADDVGEPAEMSSEKMKAKMAMKGQMAGAGVKQAVPELRPIATGASRRAAIGRDRIGRPVSGAGRLGVGSAGSRSARGG